MDLATFRKEYIKIDLGIDDSYGRILAIIDFGNVNHWFEQDRQNIDGRVLGKDEKLRIDLNGLKDFIEVFASETRFYYGHDSKLPESLRFLMASKHVFGSKMVFTKPIQKIRAYSKV